VTDTSTQRITAISNSVITFALVMYAAFLPHSIAVTQAIFLLGIVAWGVQLFMTGKLRQQRTPVDLAIFGFFACCVISSFLSYVPLVSIKGLRSPALFFAFYFVCKNVKSLRFAKFLTLLVVISCLANVAYSIGQVAVGRGLRIDSITPDGAFDREGLVVGDVVLQADGQKIKTFEDLSRVAASQRGRMQIIYQRNEAIGEASISRKAIRKTNKEAPPGLGITTSSGRSFRVTGFYSHYETYAEVLQLIALLAIGLLISQPNKRKPFAVFLAVSAVLIAAALILTSTRAAMAGLAIGVGVVAFVSARRRLIGVAILTMIILAPLAYLAIKHSRGDILFNLREESTTYRIEVWREAFSLIKDNPIAGIGKGSEGSGVLQEKYALYNNGKLPPGHFHSTIIQVATWWGLPALIFYIALMTILFFEMVRLSKRLQAQQAWEIWGIALGGIGALVAFNVSSLVHFNFGDGEVVMAFWFIMGLVFAVRRLALEKLSDDETNQPPTRASVEDLQKNLPLAPETIVEANARAAAVTRNSKGQ
jgi:hypothetical protein